MFFAIYRHVCALVLFQLYTVLLSDTVEDSCQTWNLMHSVSIVNINLIIMLAYVTKSFLRIVVAKKKKKRIVVAYQWYNISIQHSVLSGIVSFPHLNFAFPSPFPGCHHESQGGFLQCSVPAPFRHCCEWAGRRRGRREWRWTRSGVPVRGSQPPERGCCQWTAGALLAARADPRPPPWQESQFAST